MKIKLPASVQIQVPGSETIAVSARQIIEHVVRTNRDLGLSGDVERVRIAARILAALDGSELADADWTEAKKALTKPSRGWAVIVVDVAVPVPPGAAPKTIQRQLVPSGVDLLSIIDGLLSA